MLLGHVHMYKSCHVWVTSLSRVHMYKSCRLWVRHSVTYICISHVTCWSCHRYLHEFRRALIVGRESARERERKKERERESEREKNRDEGCQTYLNSFSERERENESAYTYNARHYTYVRVMSKGCTYVQVMSHGRKRERGEGCNTDLH